jgi:hypothetical protein
MQSFDIMTHTSARSRWPDVYPMSRSVSWGRRVNKWTQLHNMHKSGENKIGSPIWTQTATFLHHHHNTGVMIYASILYLQYFLPWYCFRCSDNTPNDPDDKLSKSGLIQLSVVPSRISPDYNNEKSWLIQKNRDWYHFQNSSPMSTCFWWRITSLRIICSETKPGLFLLAAWFRSVAWAWPGVHW